MWLISNQATQDNYTPAGPGSCTLEHLHANRLTIRVHNAAIYIQRKTPIGGLADADWESEILYIPGFYTIARPLIHGVRARSAIAGQPALITIEALGPNE